MVDINQTGFDIFLLIYFIMVKQVDLDSYRVFLHVLLVTTWVFFSSSPVSIRNSPVLKHVSVMTVMQCRRSQRVTWLLRGSPLLGSVWDIKSEGKVDQCSPSTLPGHLLP